MLPDVARHSGGCYQQRGKRDEKCNHHPAHEVQITVIIPDKPGLDLSFQGL